jgi:hypothetical protein
MKIEGNELRPVTSSDETKKAVASFKKKRKRSAGGGAGALDVPSDLKKALSNLPSGFKLAYGGDGAPRIVRSRRRRKTKA